jgi:hypothetical protein
VLFWSRWRRSRLLAVGAVVLALAAGFAVGPLGLAAAAVGNQLPRANWEWLGSSDNASIQLSGWAFDPDDVTAQSTVHVYIDGGATVLSASRTRTDVAAAFPGVGVTHGYALDVPIGPGTHRVCVYAIDVQVWWQNTSLGCRQIAVQLETPVGQWEAMSTSNGNVIVSGWTDDPNSPDPTEVHAYLGSYVYGGIADDVRWDVQAIRGGAPEHGFHIYLGGHAGTFPVCLYAIDNQYKWAHASLGCRTITIGMSPPVGQWESLTASGTTIGISGWTFDPDYTYLINVRVSVDGVPTSFATNDVRPDVWAVYPARNYMTLGFHWSTTVAPGSHQVCVEALDGYLPVRNTSFGCRSITV